MKALENLSATIAAVYLRLQEQRHLSHQHSWRFMSWWPCRRCGGRWLTDVTPLMPLLHAGQKCRFTFQMPPWVREL